MTCEPCEQRRRALFDAWQQQQIAEAVKQAALGAAELVGIKKKDG